MNITQALTVSKNVLQRLADTKFFDDTEEKQFEKEFGISHAQIVNALPIIEAMEMVEGAKYS